MTRTLLPPDSKVLMIEFDEPIRETMLIKTEIIRVNGSDVCDVFSYDFDTPFICEIYYN